MVTCMGLLGVIFSTFYVRVIDRRVIMLVGTAACGLSQLAQAIAWSAAPNTVASGKVVVAFIALFTFFYVAYGKSSSICRCTNLAKRASSTLRLAPWWRIPQQRPPRLRLWSRHGTQLPWELARYLHSTLLHQPSRSKLGTQIWLYLVRLKHDLDDLHVVLHP